MTLSEFKAWFEGFSEGIDTAPTAAQFAKIKAKVAEINGVALTREVIVERYRPFWGGSIPGYPTHIWNGPVVTYAGNIGQVSAAGLQAIDASFDSQATMRAIGAAEAHAA